VDRHYFDRKYCAIITPFKCNSLEIDYDAFRNLIRYFTRDPEYVKLKGSFVVNPEASEMFYMTRDERINLIKIMMEERLEDMPIFAGVFGVTVDEAIDCALDAKNLGVDGLFIFPPCGTMEVSTAIDNVNYPETWTRWVKAIDDVVDLPIILHPAAPFTIEWGQSLPIECIKMMLDEIPNIVGYKMIYGNDAVSFRVARFFRSYPRHVSILNGPNYSWLIAEMCGLVDGSVQGSWNWDKEAYYAVAEAMEKNDLSAVGKVISTQIIPLWEYIYAGGTRIHVRYKLAAWLRGLISHPYMRPPMPPPTREEATKLYQIIKNSGLSIIGEDEFEAVLAKQEEIIATGIHRKK